MSALTILLTGSRSPVTLHAARAFKEAGYRVVCVDSLSPTLTQFSSSIAKHYTIGKPGEDLETFTKELEQIIKQETVHLLIPMCEEGIFISKIRSKLSCEVFTTRFEIIEMLHNKWSFHTLLKELSILTPWTQLIQNEEDLKALPIDKKFVFKRIYSRFAVNALVKEKGEKLPKIENDLNNPYLVQEFIEGEKLCSYSVVREGELTAYAEYLILQSMGIGSGISIVSTFHPDVYDFVKTIVKKINFTGQIAFDFIRSKNGDLYGIECNPRATSGLHFFEMDAAFACSFIEKIEHCLFAPQGIYKRDMLLSLWYGIKQGDIIKGCFWKCFFKGKSPFFCRKDMGPALAIPFILFHVIKMTILQKRKIHEVMSRGLEYNGEEQHQTKYSISVTGND